MAVGEARAEGLSLRAEGLALRVAELEAALADVDTKKRLALLEMQLEQVSARVMRGRGGSAIGRYG